MQVSWKFGNAVGYNIALLDNKGLLILIGFIIGVVTVLAEPAAYVLVDEVEQVTNGNLKRSVVLFTLSLGRGSCRVFVHGADSNPAGAVVALLASWIHHFPRYDLLCS